MTEYIHTIGSDLFAQMMMHNTFLRNGYLYTGAAALQAVLLEHEGFVISPYSHFNTEKEKERIWEEIRQAEFADLPSRKDALFLFEDENSYEVARESWWNGQERRKLKAEIREKSIHHKADAKWLNCDESKYVEHARAYWSGEATDSPIFEVVVQGIIFFPEWQDFTLITT